MKIMLKLVGLFLFYVVIYFAAYAIGSSIAKDLLARSN